MTDEAQKNRHFVRIEGQYREAGLYLMGGASNCQRYNRPPRGTVPIRVLTLYQTDFCGYRPSSSESEGSDSSDSAAHDGDRLLFDEDLRLFEGTAILTVNSPGNVVIGKEAHIRDMTEGDERIVRCPTLDSV